MADWKEGERTYPSGMVEYWQRWRGITIWSTDKLRWRTVFTACKTTWHGTVSEARKRAIREAIQFGLVSIDESFIAELQVELKNEELKND